MQEVYLRGFCKTRKDSFLDLFQMETEKNKKITLRRLPFLFFLSPFEKSLKNLFFSSFAKASKD
jgi:hypothetical protein